MGRVKLDRFFVFFFSKKIFFFVINLDCTTSEDYSLFLRCVCLYHSCVFFFFFVQKLSVVPWKTKGRLWGHIISHFISHHGEISMGDCVWNARAQPGLLTKAHSWWIIPGLGRYFWRLWRPIDFLGRVVDWSSSGNGGSLQDGLKK